MTQGLRTGNDFTSTYRNAQPRETPPRPRNIYVSGSFPLTIDDICVALFAKRYKELPVLPKRPDESKRPAREEVREKPKTTRTEINPNGPNRRRAKFGVLFGWGQTRMARKIFGLHFAECGFCDCVFDDWTDSVPAYGLLSHWTCQKGASGHQGRDSSKSENSEKRGQNIGHCIEWVKWYLIVGIFVLKIKL